MRNIFTINIDQSSFKSYVGQIDWSDSKQVEEITNLSLEFNEKFQEQINLMLFDNFKELSKDYQYQINLYSEPYYDQFTCIRVIFETFSEEAQRFYEDNYNLFYNSFSDLFNSYYKSFLDKAKELGYLK